MPPAGTMAAPEASAPLIVADGIGKHYAITRGVVFSRQLGMVKAVDGVSFQLAERDAFGLVGESGCGKTTTARLLLRLETVSYGSLRYHGQDVATLNAAQRRLFRHEVQAVFQDPFSALNPRMRVGEIIGEPLVIAGMLGRAERTKRVAAMLERVGLDSRAARLYPHEFSGGQRQRIAIARALVTSPRLVVLDEPVASLDASIRSQIINLLRDLQDEFGIGYFLISHDLATTRHLCRTISVMYLGRIVEVSPADELIDAPRHPYAQALLASYLPVHAAPPSDELVLEGEVPSPLDPPSGCRFHPRCPHIMERCVTVEPPLLLMPDGRQVACHLYDEPAPAS